jgi:diguanylate cyclase (GGDEF)-like protein/PAS domain S-box-containing protein
MKAETRTLLDSESSPNNVNNAPAVASGTPGQKWRRPISGSNMQRIGSAMRQRLAGHQAQHGAHEIAQSCSRLASVLEASADLVLFGDAAGCITSVNATACRLLGKSPKQLCGMPWDMIYAPTVRKQMSRVLTNTMTRSGIWHGDIPIVSDAGVEIATAQVITAHTDDTGRTGYFSVVARDLSDRNAFEERIRKLQIYDALTGLPALRHARQAVDHLIAQRRAGRGVVAVVSINLDGFRLVDEGFGREVGDEVLKTIGVLLRETVQERDVVARISADEFLVSFSEAAEWTGTEEAVQAILDVIAAPRVVAGQTLRMTASAGIATFPADGSNFEALLGKSHAAMCLAKGKTHGGIQFYAGDIEQSARRHLRLETDLRNAIGSNELTLKYQPQFEIDTGKVSGVEALARWTTNGGEAISPAVFIPLAEQSGLIGPLGAWVLKEACSTAAAWRGTSGEPLTICVNVSSLQLSADFAATVARALEASGCAPSRLELELTESALLVHPEFSINCLLELKRLGVRIALDDFGTGYSSLSYLSRLPVDRLKVDQTLIKDMTTDKKTAAIVRTIINLGKDLGLSVIAEGVETTQQLEMLQNLGCDQAQGFLLGRPLPPKACLLGLTRRATQSATHLPQRRWIGESTYAAQL